MIETVAIFPKNCDMFFLRMSKCPIPSPQFRPPIALRNDLSHITTELWEISVLRMAH